MGVGKGEREGEMGSLLGIYLCKQLQFCFKEMILFPRSLLNDAFKGLFFFFHLKHFFFFFFFLLKLFFFFFFALEGRKREEKANKAITKC